MDHVGFILPKVLKSRGMFDHVQASIVIAKANAWIEKTAPSLRDRVVARTLRDGILLLDAIDSLALQEGRLCADMLRQFIAMECPEAMIHEVKVLRASGGKP
jgi:hypothetical protein